jgi:hypothetical protein
LEGHHHGWDEAKEYYKKIFEKELKQAKQTWRKGGANEEYSEEITEQYKEPEVNDEWMSYGQCKGWGENLSAARRIVTHRKFSPQFV